MQLIELGYDSDKEGEAAFDDPTFSCGRCDRKTSAPEAAGRVTLSVGDNGSYTDLWTKPGLVGMLVPKPAADWGEVDSPERRSVDRMLDEWIGKRYKATMAIQAGMLYCLKLEPVDGSSKKRRTT